MLLAGERAMGMSWLPLRAARACGPVADAQEPLAADVALGETPCTSAYGVGEKAMTDGVPVFGGPEQALSAVPKLSREEKSNRLGAMDEEEVKVCRRCRLCETRRHTVFGEGDPEGAIFFIGEGPGESEDLSGRPFVGRAGQKLDEMIAAMGLARAEVYIGNIVKCRPPQNRVPAPDETAACTPYLVRQIEIVQPKVIVSLGLPATKYLTGSTVGITRLRGQWHSWRGIKLMPTYHPSYILRCYTSDVRKAVWSDLQKVMTEVGLKLPERRGNRGGG